jgi:hypothetical protein
VHSSYLHFCDCRRASSCRCLTWLADRGPMGCSAIQARAPALTPGWPDTPPSRIRYISARGAGCKRREGNVGGRKLKGAAGGVPVPDSCSQIASHSRHWATPTAMLFKYNLIPLVATPYACQHDCWRDRGCEHPLVLVCGMSAGLCLRAVPAAVHTSRHKLCFQNLVDDIKHFLSADPKSPSRCCGQRLLLV